jgi:hypothetical protein
LAIEHSRLNAQQLRERPGVNAPRAEVAIALDVDRKIEHVLPRTACGRLPYRAVPALQARPIPEYCCVVYTASAAQ